MKAALFAFAALAFAGTSVFAQQPLQLPGGGLQPPPFQRPEPRDFPPYGWIPAPGRPLPEIPRDCGAATMQGYVGQPLSVLPPVGPFLMRREVCHVCPRTMDYVSHRQTVEYDEETQIILSISCG